jgi:ADP-heptose:LPS heptosyltransferase
MMSDPTSGKTPEVQSLLVIHQGALGDFILALPSLEALRKGHPQAKSVIMGYPRILELVEQRFYAEEVLSIDQKGMASFFVRGGPLDRSLSQFFSTFDLIVIFGKDAEGPIIGNLRRVCQGRILHVDPFPPWDEGIHITDHLLKQFAQYGFFPSELNPRLHLKKSDRDWGRDFWRRKGLTMEERSRAVILHPGSGSRKKVWPLDRFLELVRYLRKHLPSKIVIVLGPAEGLEVHRIFEEMEWEMGANAPILVKGLSLLKVASVIEGSRLFIGNDSGISHMAAALGIPTIAIFGPTDPRVWSPRGKKVCVVRREFPCSPCSQERFVQCQHLGCLRGVETGEVLKGLGRMGAGFKA